MLGHAVTFSLDLLSIPCFFSAKGSNKCIVLDGILSERAVKIQLISDNKSPCINNADEASGRFFYNHVKITITDEIEDLRSSDYIEGRARYLLMTYQQIVVEAVNRLVSYFKYDKRNPHLRNISHFDLLKQDHEFYNPEWRTLDGEPLTVSKAPITSGIISIPGVGLLQDNFFGITPFVDEDIAPLQYHVFSGRNTTLTDELLSDAQSSALSHHLRRAVLELAISIEVFVKSTFFKREKIAGSAFEYLEDKGKENIKVIELLDGVSLYAFGESFRKHSPDAYRDIDYIFRCRNKIAHRGECKYRDDSGDWREVDIERLRSWWNSTLAMFNWLKVKTQSNDASNSA